MRRPSTSTGRTYVWTAPVDVDGDPSLDGRGVPRRGRGDDARPASPPTRPSRSTVPSPRIERCARTCRRGRRRGCSSSARSASRSCSPSRSSWRSSSGTTWRPRVARLTAVGARRRDRAAFLDPRGGVSRRSSAARSAGSPARSSSRSSRLGRRRAPVRSSRGAILGPTSLAGGARRHPRSRPWPRSWRPPPGRSGRGGRPDRRRGRADGHRRARLADSPRAGRSDTTALARAIRQPGRGPAAAGAGVPRGPVLTTAMPPLLRAVTRRFALARRSARPPVPAVPISRDPGRPAATLTLLAFSIGAIVFATCWSATLRGGIDDARRLSVRARPAGDRARDRSVDRPSVVPVDRYAALGRRRHRRAGLPRGQHVPTGRPGRDPRHRPDRPADAARLARRLLGDTGAAELADAPARRRPRRRLARSAGHRLPAGRSRTSTCASATAASRCGSTRSSGPTAATASAIPLGHDPRRHDHASARPLPTSAIGGRLTTLDLLQRPARRRLRPPARRLPVDGRVRGPRRPRRRSRPIDLEIFTVVDGHHPRAAGDRRPGPAGRRQPGPRAPTRARTGRSTSTSAAASSRSASSATADRAPTVVDAGPALRRSCRSIRSSSRSRRPSPAPAGRPRCGSASPNPQRQAEVRAALAEPPFRFAQVTARADLVAAAGGRPAEPGHRLGAARRRARRADAVGRRRCSSAPSPTCATSAASWPTSRPRASRRRRSAGTRWRGPPGSRSAAASPASSPGCCSRSS